MGECLKEKSNKLSGEMFAKRLPDGGVIAAKVSGEPDQRESVNNPFRGIEVVPLRSVAKIAGVGMMKVVVTLAKTDEGDQPTIAATVLCGVWL